jgi:hypothetical protein
MRGAVVPLVGTRDTVVTEIVAHRIPGDSAVIRALDKLAEPAAALGGVKAIRIGGRTRDMKNLPSREMRSLHVPLPTPLVGGEDECALSRADQDPYSGHCSLPVVI